MTIMDKDDKNITASSSKKKRQKKKQHLILYKIISFILIIMTTFTFGYIIYQEIFSIFYLIPIILISVSILFVISFLLNKTKLRSWIKNIFSFISILIIIFEIFLILYSTQTLKFLSSITDTGYRVETFGVYVLKDSGYNELNQLENKMITYLNHTDDTNIREALSKIEKEITIENDYVDSIQELVNTLISEETDAILVERSYEGILKEEFESTYEKMILVKEIDIVDVVETLKSDADVTKDSFAVYISGIDTSGNVASKARSDVNLIMAVNPKTKNILLINTPRDYYVNLHSKQKMDKLTHAGLFGVEESLMTLEDLYDVDIDYYARINFTSFVKIVDALDGIKVDVPKKFCEQNSDRSFASGDLICLNKGMQKLNGEQALALARHRKTIGDRARGKNQMMVLETIINKAISPKILTNYSNLLNALEGRVSTNMTTDDLIRFIKKQLKEDFNWRFTNVSVTGKDSRGKAYSTGNANVYIMEADEESVNYAKQAIDNLFNDYDNVLEGLEETTTKAQ